MQFFSPLPKAGRVPLDGPAIRFNKTSVTFSLPAKTVSAMAWVKGDKIEIGYDRETRRFGLRRGKTGFGLVLPNATPNGRYQINVNNKHLARMGADGPGVGGPATSVQAIDGILYLGDPREDQAQSAPVQAFRSQVYGAAI